ncbi:spindle assembly abnormal protein 6 homolog [Bufo bufo]|uniref:spindle assembly abnormal protein 6 homolog n=1 Tax=Bufo bufo TaxID=8384 RepID=UPI001ABDF758|nr:spindle assembly abnormal protein 6 homolog [Bufo bufo]
MMEELFCKLVTIIIKCRDCEERRSTVRLTVETHCFSKPAYKKDLIVRLSDDADPFFLYNLTLGEEDFISLKNQQGLLVEYSAFPQRFIELLEQCISEQEKSVPRFLLQLLTSSSGLDCMSASLNVIETNPFKHLVHLSLKLLEGNDSDIKKYLADCIKSLKLENCLLKGKLVSSEEDFSQKICLLQQGLEEKCTELSKLRNEWTSQTSFLTSRHTQEITAEREKVLQIQTQYQHQYEQQKKELESSSNRTIQHLESRVSELEALNKDLTERKYKSESCIREIKGKLAVVEEENHRAKQEIASLRRETSALDSECHEREKLLNQYKMRTAVLEQEVKAKEEVVIKSTDACESAQQHEKKLEESLEHKQLQTVKLETTIKSLSEELIKANEIIKKLQTDMKKLVDKMKLKNAVTMQQEKLLGGKEQMLQKEKTELANVKHSLKMKEDEVLKLQKQLECTTEKLEESKQLLKTNENVISWLNKQLNENKIAPFQGAQGLCEIPGLVKTINPPSNMGTIQNNQVRFSLNFPSDCSPTLEPRHIPSTSTPVLPPTSCDSIGLDMKYLKRNASVPVKGPKNVNGTSSGTSKSVLPKSGSSPILSAYFPGQQPRLPAS